MGDGFVSLYKRHVPFTFTTEVQPIETDQITIQPRGDLVSYVYLTRTEISTGKIIPWDWSSILDFSWYIGNKLIDKQDVNFLRYINPALMSRTHAKSNFDTVIPTFLPLAFSFCHELPFPIVALNYDKMYIKFTLGQTYNTSLYGYQCHITYIHLNEDERNFFALSRHFIPITQTQQIFNRSDVMLRNPVKFIATTPIKIPNTSQFSVKVNDKFIREPHFYTGSENYYHTYYSTNEEPTVNNFPPDRLVGPETFLSTAYGRGFYKVRASSNSFVTLPWNATSGDSNGWETAKLTLLVTEFKATATSNSSNAWRAFSTENTFWKSDPYYGSPNVYIITASSNVGNAWSPAWSSDTLYGNNVGASITANASSNVSFAGLAFDGRVDTTWVSNSSFYSDYVGTYAIQASSNSVGSNVRSAFIGGTSTIWESNVAYGSVSVPGTYEALTNSNSQQAWRIFDSSLSTNWTSNINFYAYVSNVDLNVYSSSELTSNVVRAFNGGLVPWVSNSLSNTYGFSSRFGTYTASSLYDTTSAWRIFDGDTATQWLSNATFYQQFAPGLSFNVHATSNTTNAWLVSDYRRDTFWSSNGSIFGNFTAPGVYTISASSNSVGTDAWKISSADPFGWSSNEWYGNFFSSGATFTASSSSNIENAWMGLSQTNTWTGTDVYGQIGIQGGVYTGANSSSTQDSVSLIFGNSSTPTWRSNVQYGTLLAEGTYSASNTAVFSNTGLFFSNVEFLTTADAGTYTASASANSASAWTAFNDTFDFNWDVDVYKSTVRPPVTIVPMAPPSAPSEPRASSFTEDYTNNGTINTNLGAHYSHTAVGTYRVTTNHSGPTSFEAFRAFDSQSSTFYTPNRNTPLFDENGNPTSTDPYVEIQFPRPVNYDTFTATVTGVNSSELRASNDNGSTYPLAVANTNYDRFRYIVKTVSRSNYPINTFSYVFNNNKLSTPNTSQGLFNFVTNAEFSPVKTGTYTVSPTDSWRVFNASSPTAYTYTSSSSGNLVMTLTAPDNTSFPISPFTLNPSSGATQSQQISGSNRIFTFNFPTTRTSATPAAGSATSTTNNKYGLVTFPRSTTASSGVTIGANRYTIPNASTSGTPAGFQFNGTTAWFRYDFDDKFVLSAINLACTISDANAGKGLENFTTITFTDDLGTTPVGNPTTLTSCTQPVPQISTSFLQSSNMTPEGGPSKHFYFSVYATNTRTVKNIKFTPTVAGASFQVYTFVSSLQLTRSDCANQSLWSAVSGTGTNFTTVSSEMTIQIGGTAGTTLTNGQYLHIAIINLGGSDFIPRRFSDPASFTGSDFVNGWSATNPIGGISFSYGIGAAGTPWNSTDINSAGRRGIIAKVDFTYSTGQSVFQEYLKRWSLASPRTIRWLRVDLSSPTSAAYNIYFTPGVLNGQTQLFLASASTLQDVGGVNTSIQPTALSGQNPYLGTASRGSYVGEYYTFTIPNPSTGRIPLSNFSLSPAQPSSDYVILNENNALITNGYTGGTVYVVFTSVTNGLNIPSSLQLRANGPDSTQVYASGQTYLGNYSVTVNSISYTASPRLIPSNFTGNSTNINSAEGQLGGPCINSASPPTLEWTTTGDFEVIRVSAFAFMVGASNPFPTSIEYQYRDKNQNWTSSVAVSGIGREQTRNFTNGSTVEITGFRFKILEISGLTNALTVLETRLFNQATTITSSSGLSLCRNPRITQLQFTKSYTNPPDSFDLIPRLSSATQDITAPPSSSMNGLYYAYTGSNPKGDFIEIRFTSTPVRITRIQLVGVFDQNFVEYSYSTDNGITYTNPTQATIVSQSTPATRTSARTVVFNIPPPSGAIPNRCRIFFTQSVPGVGGISITAITLFDGDNDIRNSVFARGGIYTGASITGTVTGEWAECVLPTPITLTSVRAIAPRSDPYPTSWSVFAKTGASTYTQVLTSQQALTAGTDVTLPVSTVTTSDTFRFSVQSTNSPASSNTCRMGNIILYSPDGRKSANLTTSSTVLLTSGINVFSFSNTVTATTIKTSTQYDAKRNYTFTRDRWFSNTLQAFMYSGTVIAPYAITANQAVFETNSPNTDIVWIGSNADFNTFSLSNNLFSHYNVLNKFTINQGFSAGQSFQIRVISYDPRNITPTFSISSNSGTTLTNTRVINGQWFAGGAYNGFDTSNLSIQLNLPSAVNVSHYLFNANTAASWQVYGGASTKIHETTRAGGGLVLYPITSPGSYSTYRVSIDKSDIGVLYPSVRTLAFRQATTNCAVIDTFGTFTQKIPISTCPIGFYSTTSSGQVFTINLPAHVTVHAVYVVGQFTNFTINGGATQYTRQGYSRVSSLAISNVYTFTFTGLSGTPTIELLNDTIGYILPSASERNQLVLRSASRGGPYRGSELTGTEPGEWIELSTTAQFRVFQYDLSSTNMPPSWSAHGWNGSTWTLIDKVSNIYNGTYAYSNIVNNDRIGPWSKFRVVFSNSIQSNVSITTLNLYSSNFQTLFKPGTLPDTPTSTYVPTVYSNTGTFFDVPTRTWISNSSTINELVIEFDAPARVQRISYNTNPTPYGLVYTIFDSAQTPIPSDFRFISSKVISTGYSSELTLGSNRPYLQTGFMYTYGGGTFTFVRSGSAPFYLWFNTTGALTAANATMTQTTPTSGILRTASFPANTFVPITIYSGGGGVPQLTANCSVDRPNIQTSNFQNWLFPTANTFQNYFESPVDLQVLGQRIDAQAGTYTTLLNASDIRRGPINVFTTSDQTSYFSQLKIRPTKTNGYPYTVMRNITLYNESGPINIPGAFGGIYRGSATTTGASPGEWVQIQLPAAMAAHSYSFKPETISRWTLAGSTNGSTWTPIDTRSNVAYSSSRYSIASPVQYSYYRFIVNETGATLNGRANVSEFKLFGQNDIELVPYNLQSNTTTLASNLAIGTSLVGSYAVTSSSLVSNPGGAFGLRGGPTIFTTYNLNTGNYEGPNSTTYNRVNIQLGEWVQLEFPSNVAVSSFVIRSPVHPWNFTFSSSNDAIHWMVSNVQTSYTRGAVPLINDRANIPCKFYRLLVNAVRSGTTTCSINRIDFLDPNGNRLNAFTDTTRTFGGKTTVPQFIDLTLPAPRIVTSIIVDSPTNQFGSNIFVYGDNSLIAPITRYSTQESNVLYTIPNPGAYSSYRIQFNELEYNSTGANVYTRNVKLLDQKNIPIVPVLDTVSRLYAAESIQNTPVGVYTVSNTFPFDDNTQTRWTSQMYDPNTGAASGGSASSFDIRFPTNVSIIGYALYGAHMNTWTLANATTSQTQTNQNLVDNTWAYYQVVPPMTSDLFTFSVSKTIIGSSVTALGGIEFFDSIGRVNPTITASTQLINSTTLRGGKASGTPEGITINLPFANVANSYTITADPFPASWNVFSGSTLIQTISNYHSTGDTATFSLPNIGPTSNLTFSIYETQPSTSFNEKISYIQLYDTTGKMILPKFNSNITYQDYQISSEVYGYYEVLSSSNLTSVINAFDGSETNYYESLSYNPLTQVDSNGFTMYFANGIVFNCTDFRSLNLASKGVNPSGPCTWVGKMVAGSTIVRSVLPNSVLIVSAIDADTIQISKSDFFPYNVFTQPLIDNPIMTPYVTAGVAGEWIQIKMPTFIRPTGYRVVADSNAPAWTLLGSVDSTNWVVLHAVDTNTEYVQELSLGSSSYMYFRLVIRNQPIFTRFRIYHFELYNDSGRINSYLGPLQSSEYPPLPMTGPTTVLPDGTYVASASSFYNQGQISAPWKAFNKVATGEGDSWGTSFQGGNQYNSTTGLYQSPLGYNVIMSGTRYDGEWLSIELPTPIILRSYSIQTRPDYAIQTARAWALGGSNDGTTWTLIETRSGQSFTGAMTRTYTITSNPDSFRYYRLCFTQTQSGFGNGVGVGEWRLYGI